MLPPAAQAQRDKDYVSGPAQATLDAAAVGHIHTRSVVVLQSLHISLYIVWSGSMDIPTTCVSNLEACTLYDLTVSSLPLQLQAPLSEERRLWRKE